MSTQASPATQADFLKSAMDAYGLDDSEERAGIAAISMGESHMEGHTETGYAHTNNDRIRIVFGERVHGMSDARLDVLKADDRAWFNYMYGPNFSTGRDLGNIGAEDGYNFRGRGPLQLTGRANYARYGEMCGHPEIVTDPDKANDPEIGAALAVAYIDDRWDGVDFDSMMRCVGNNTPDIAAAKEAYYEQFMQSGEYAPTEAHAEPVQPSKRGKRPSVAPAAEPVPSLVESLVKKVETAVGAAESIL